MIKIDVLDKTVKTSACVMAFTYEISFKPLLEGFMESQT